jgi:hypothetical protein
VRRGCYVGRIQHAIQTGRFQRDAGAPNGITIPLCCGSNLGESAVLNQTRDFVEADVRLAKKHHCARVIGVRLPELDLFAQLFDAVQRVARQGSRGGLRGGHSGKGDGN